MNVDAVNNQRRSAESDSPYGVERTFAPYDQPGVQFALNQEDLSAIPENMALVPADRSRNFHVRTGFAYFLVTINFYEGVKIGLFVKHYRNQVIVSKVDDASLAAESLKVLDRIVDVNGAPVSDKDVCKTLIVRALEKEGAVNMIIERPVDPAAVELMEARRHVLQNALSVSTLQTPSVAMASDVKSIVRRYNEKLKQGFGEIKPINILKRPGRAECAAERHELPHIQIDDNKKDIVMIGMDHESKMDQLKKVPPKPSSKNSSNRSKRKRRKRH